MTFPLHESVKQKNSYITSNLMLFGADPCMKDTWGHTASHYAKGMEILEVLDPRTTRLKL